ncbi:MAG: DUF371 domain-containing protein [Archaeoglobaceae archaeon]|nr:DUF371 domain-containing protein [Archaeoglobaceae archaeon]MDW8128086.1 DUF371 domain-containing protein [Archaeoglobaceae archaeon]
MIIFEVHAFGHPNITAKHRTTLQVTKEAEISKRADCIIGVKADKSISEIPNEAKIALKKGLKVELDILLPDHDIKETLIGFGDERLSFTHEEDIVIRKSKFVCGRTLLIRANKSARDLKREILDLLKDKKTELILLFKIEDH